MIREVSGVNFDKLFASIDAMDTESFLGFIAEITYRTVPDHPHKASALVFFADVAAACEAVAR